MTVMARDTRARDCPPQRTGADRASALSLILSAFRPGCPERARRLTAAFGQLSINLTLPGSGSSCLVTDRGPQQGPVLHFRCEGGEPGLRNAAGDVAWALRLALGRRPALCNVLHQRLRETAASVLSDHLRYSSARELIYRVQKGGSQRCLVLDAEIPFQGGDALWPWLADEALWGAERPQLLMVHAGQLVPGRPPVSAALAELSRTGAEVLASAACAGLRAVGAATDGPAQSDLNLAAGAAVRLLKKSDYHRQFDPVHYLAEEILPPFALAQAVIVLSPEATPLGLVSWARIAPEVEAALHRSGRALVPVEWDSGPHLFFNDWITQGLSVRSLVAWMRTRFPDPRASSLRRKPDRTIRRISDWRQDADPVLPQAPIHQTQETTA